MWVLFVVPCPTPDGQTAQDLYGKRVERIGPEMQASARELGCRFHRAWYAADGSAFYAVANWESRPASEAASASQGLPVPGMGKEGGLGRCPGTPAEEERWPIAFVTPSRWQPS